MKKMLYCMHVDINWIKQRPHFIAEYLDKQYNLVVCYPYFYTRKVLNSDGISLLHTQRLYRVPSRIRIKTLHLLSDWINGLQVKQCIKKFKPDYLYLCAPRQISYIPDDFKGKVIYDCMDDLVALAKGNMAKKMTEENERFLVKKADYIFASSQELVNVLQNRYSKENITSINVVRNAYNGKILNCTESDNDNKKYIICYFGTIAQWFNFEFVMKSLDDFSNIEYMLIGPIIEGVSIPNHERLQYVGVVDHSTLDQYAEKADCFIMPFIVNDIIKSVDPVKFYEYLNYNKNIISVFYDEIKRFENYVIFYNSYDEYKSAIQKALSYKHTKYSHEERIRFLQDNTWDARCRQIVEILEGQA